MGKQDSAAMPAAPEVESAESHSPLPWRVRDRSFEAALIGHDEDGWADFTTADNEMIGSAYCNSAAVNAANADFIVRAVNCHEELVAALRALVGIIDRAGHYTEISDLIDSPGNEIETARAALSRAEGVTP